MSREVRRVPADWDHPVREDGNHQPMYDRSFEDAAREWKEKFAAWERHDVSKFEYPPLHGFEGQEFWEWEGNPPDRDYYRPHREHEERTHYQMYETVSEGTPISPVMATPEELARWLADNGASAFADDTATYEQWLAVCKGGYAPSVVVDGGRVMSGVEYLGSKGEGGDP